MDATGMSSRIWTTDTQYVTNGIEHLVIIIAVILAVWLAIKHVSWITKRMQTIAWVLVVIWIVAVTAQYVASVYLYVKDIRPLYTRSQRNY